MPEAKMPETDNATVIMIITTYSATDTKTPIMHDLAR